MLAVCLVYGLSELIADLIKFEVFQQSSDSFGTHKGFKRLSIFLFCFSEFFFAEQLTDFQGALSRLCYNILLEIDNFLQVGGFHCQKVSKPIWYSFEKPYMHNRSRQIDMPHSLSSDAAMGNFNSTSIANYSLELCTFVLPAGTFPVTFRSKDSLAE